MRRLASVVFGLAVLSACAPKSASQQVEPGRQDAIYAAAGDKVRIDWIKEEGGATHVRGNATSPQNVGAFRKELEGLVVTPRGIGPTVSKTEGAVTVRLPDSTNATFRASEVRPLCGSLDQKRGEQFSILNKPAIYNFELICTPGASVPQGGACAQTSQCAEGLRCCEQPSGIQKPSGHSTCVKPCVAGSQFCTDGCYYPPVP